MKDMVNHPPHYNDSEARCDKCGDCIECIEVAKNHCFMIGNAIKYIWRAGKKEGSTLLLDLKKAQWYLNRKIQELENGQNNK